MRKENNFHEKYGRQIASPRASDRKFGFVFTFIFLSLSLIFYIKNNQLNLFLLFLSFLFLTLSVFRPKILGPLNKGWRLLGLALQKIVSPVILAFVYFFVFTPTAFFLKIVKKDVLDLKLEPSKESYWIRSSVTPTNMKDQF